MTWNYRLISKYDVSGTWFDVHEVYYNDKGEPVMYTEDPISLGGEDLEDIVGVIDMILSDIKKYPPMSKADLPETYVDDEEF